MHPVLLLGPIATVYPSLAGLLGWRPWHIATAALLIAGVNIGRALLGHVGPIALQAMSSVEALSRGAEQFLFRQGTRGAGFLLAGQLVLGFVLAALIYGAGFGVRRLLG